MTVHSKPRCFEQPDSRSAHTGPGLSAGDRTASLRRRTLFETTKAQAKTALKRHDRGQPLATNDANGDLRFDPATKCLHYSYSHAAHLDANVGAALSRGRCGDTPAGVAQVKHIEAKGLAGATRRRGGIYESGSTLASYVAPGEFQVDASHNAGAYNRIFYDPHSRLGSDNAGYPGLVVDPSGTAASFAANGYLKWTAVDICGGGALKADMCLNTLDATALPPLLRALAPAAVLDACGSHFPFRTHFA